MGEANEEESCTKFDMDMQGPQVGIQDMVEWYCEQSMRPVPSNDYVKLRMLSIRCSSFTLTHRYLAQHSYSVEHYEKIGNCMGIIECMESIS